MDVHGVLAGYIAESTLEELEAERAAIAAHLDRVRAVADERDFVDLQLAIRIADVLTALLDDAGGYTARERALMRGAIRYFCQHDDVSGDLTSPTGFEDDAEILNAVKARTSDEATFCWKPTDLRSGASQRCFARQRTGPTKISAQPQSKGSLVEGSRQSVSTASKKSKNEASANGYSPQKSKSLGAKTKYEPSVRAIKVEAFSL